MRILLYTQYFPPETNAPANRWGYFTTFLRQKGHEIEVLTSFPNHPLGKIFPGYRNQWCFREDWNGMAIWRSWTFISPSRSFIKRSLNYLSFAFSSYWNVRKIKKPEVIIASIPPLTVGLMGQYIAARQKIPLVLDLRDFWPEAAIDTGYLRPGIMTRFWRNKARALYQRARVILVNSPGLAEELVLGYGISQGKIQLVYNGADIEFFQGGNPEIINSRYHLQNKFVVLYTGLVGYAQNVEVILEAAKKLKSHKEIIFLIVGTGPKYQELLKIKKEDNLDNVILTGLRPHSEMPSFVARADICLVPYKNSPVFKRNIPSKLYDYMAAGKPVIINLEGEASKIVLTAQAGILVEPENSQALAQAITDLEDNRILREKMGLCAQTYARQHYNKKDIGHLLESVLRYVIQKK